MSPSFALIFAIRFSLGNWAHLLPVIALALLVFSVSTTPLAFLLYPALLLVLLRLDLGWASLATLFVAIIGIWYTVHRTGPFARFTSTSSIEPEVVLQIFLAAAIFTLYSVSVVLENLRATDRRLQQIVALHKLVTDNSRDVLIVADFDGNRRFVSAAGDGWGGWDKSDLMRRKSLDLVHPEDRQAVITAIRDMRAGKDGALVECRVSKRDQSFAWTEASLRTIRDPVTGVPTGILNSVREITERKLAEQARQRQHSLIDAIHQVSLDGILVVDENQSVVSCNRKFGQVWGIDLPQNLPGHLEKDIRFPDEKFLTQVLARLKDPGAFVTRIENLYANPDEKDHCEIELKDGRMLERYSTCLRSKDGAYLGRVWFFRDITERKLAEQQLREAYRTVEALAVTDALTGLANRRHFDQCLSNEWRRGLRDRKPLSLLLIDADLFKTYNDTFGHLRGDNCLKQIAESAQDVVARPGDLVARFGGEEFAVILPNTGNSGAMRMARDICAALHKRAIPHPANSAGVATVSVGCATVVPQLGRQAATLIDCADQALYQAKRAGRNRACNYQQHVAEEANPNERLNPVAIKSA